LRRQPHYALRSNILVRPNCLFRPPVPLFAIYAIVCLSWIGFAGGIAPNIISAAYNERSLPVLNWIFKNHRSLPLEHYLDRWSVTAAAVFIAIVLHLAIVLFIGRLDRKHRLSATPPAASRINFILIIFSAAFFTVTVLSWAQGDYKYFYLDEWMVVLGADDPWLCGTPLNPACNSYGPLFNALAPLVWVNPLANKLLFAFSYLAYVIWLVKDLAPRQRVATLSWPWLSLWILNPFAWVEIAYFGYFDVLVALACVAAVHSLISKRDGISGIYLAMGVLLKYMPIVILPFLVFSERRFHFRLLSVCVGVVIFGLVVSTLIWGTSTFFPLALAAVRQPTWSIYDVLASTHSPLRLFWDWPKLPSLSWLEKPFLVTAGLGVFAWCVRRRIGPALSATLAILVTLLFFRSGYFNYQMVPFFLISYWLVSEWQQLREQPYLPALLSGYFSLLAVFELIHWSESKLFTYTDGDVLYSAMVMLKFVLNCALLVRLVQLSALHYSSYHQSEQPIPITTTPQST
jgi:Glycosyltransferase family 87